MSQFIMYKFKIIMITSFDGIKVSVCFIKDPLLFFGGWLIESSFEEQSMEENHSDVIVNHCKLFGML